MIFMSLDKAIKYGKEKRKEYTDTRAICGSCRNHGTCLVCKSNRLHQAIRVDEATKKELKEYCNGLGEI